MLILPPQILVTACTMGNVRFFFNDFEGKLKTDSPVRRKTTKRKYFLSADHIEPDLLIDNAHDMGCSWADFCKVTRLDRKS